VSNDKEKNDEYICNYSQLIIDRNLSQVDNFDKFMLLRFFYEKINKVNNFSLWYIIYFNELKYDYFVENMKENKDLKTEKEENSRDSDSNKDEKSKKNIISNKNNECIRLYKYIYEELKKNELLYRNTRYDLTGLLYHNEENNLDEEVNTNKNISYSSSENQKRTIIQKNKQLIFKNDKYPILNQDTEGFEIANNFQISEVYKNIDKNQGTDFNERLHIIIFLIKYSDRGLSNSDISLLVKIHKMKILYYVLYPRKEGKETAGQGAREEVSGGLPDMDRGCGGYPLAGL
jgi:hypothetical protein